MKQRSHIKKLELRFGCLLIAGVLMISCAKAQTIASFMVNVTGTEKFAIPVQTNLDAVTILADSSLRLIEKVDGVARDIPFQISTVATDRIINWLVTPSAKKTRNYQLIKGKVAKHFESIKTTQRGGALSIIDNDKERLQYHFETVYPPSGIDTAYKRSAFIHPLNTISGHSLTRINAPDHYHHWGLWNPWTHVLFESDTVDFWNLKDRKGTVRFAGFNKVENGSVYAGFSALHEHVVFKKDGSEKIAINEIQTVKVYKTSPNSRYYIMDISSQLSAAGESPVLLLEYRYGGMGIRATEAWDNSNSLIMTSSGKNRKEADGSTARWCVAQGKLESDWGGLEMMSYPANYNHPEPLRVWPENMNTRGDVFLNFSPTKNKNWLLQPGKTYLLQYRFLVFDDKLTKQNAEEAWQSFAHPPKLQLQQ